MLLDPRIGLPVRDSSLHARGPTDIRTQYEIATFVVTPKDVSLKAKSNVRPRHRNLSKEATKVAFLGFQVSPSGCVVELPVNFCLVREIDGVIPGVLIRLVCR